MKTLQWILLTAIMASIAAGCAQNLSPATPPTVPPTRSAAATMYATNARLRNIVYIVDSSAAVADSFEALKREMIRSVNSMIPVTRFDFIMLGEKPEPVFSQMQRATQEFKKEFAKKAEMLQAQGNIEGKLDSFKVAFEKAFAMHPDTIYFLTASAFDPQLLNVVDAINKDHKTQLNTIAFLRDDPKFQDQLRELARRNGGLYKFISPQELPPSDN